MLQYWLEQIILQIKLKQLLIERTLKVWLTANGKPGENSSRSRFRMAAQVPLLFKIAKCCIPKARPNRIVASYPLTIASNSVSIITFHSLAHCSDAGTIQGPGWSNACLSMSSISMILPIPPKAKTSPLLNLTIEFSKIFPAGSLNPITAHSTQQM